MEPWMENGDALLHIHEPPEFERAVLNQKLHSLHLSDQKLLVLQDAAQRMIRRHEAELRDTRSRHATAMAAKENSAKQRHKAEMESVRQTWERRLVQAEADEKAGRLRLKEKYQKLLEGERMEHTAQIKLLQVAHALERNKWLELESQLRSAFSTVEKASLHQLLHANNTLKVIQDELREEREQNGVLTERYERLKTRWNQLREQNEAMLAQQRSVELKAKDQVEIATSAVAAATQREQDLQEKYDALMKQFNAVMEESRHDVSTSQRYTASGPQLSFVDPDASVALSRRPNGFLGAVWNARAVQFARRWIQFIFVPRGPSSLRRRNSSSSNDT